MDKESTKWIRFLGGKNLLYTLTILCRLSSSLFIFCTSDRFDSAVFIRD